MSVVSVDQIYQALYRPDLVREKLAGDPSGKVREAAGKLDLDKVIGSGAAPLARFVSPQDRATLAQDRSAIEAEIIDRGGGVGRVEWRVNGVTLGVDERGLARTDTGTLKLRRTLDLEEGENLIELDRLQQQKPDRLDAGASHSEIGRRRQDAAATVRARGRHQRLL